MGGISCKKKRLASVVLEMASDAGFEPATVCLAYHYSFHCDLSALWSGLSLHLIVFDLDGSRLVSAPSSDEAWLRIANCFQ